MASTLSVAALLLTIWSLCITVWLMIVITNTVYQHGEEDCTDTYGTDVNSQQLPATVTTHFEPVLYASLSTPHSTSSPYRKRLLHYYSQIFRWPKDNQAILGNCTLVLLVWRVKSLQLLLRYYCDTHFFQRILIVWNTLTTNVTAQDTRLKKCFDLDVKILWPSVDKLTNRYSAWREIETDCECT